MNILFAIIFALASGYFAYDALKESREERRIVCIFSIATMLVQVWAFNHFYGLVMSGVLN